MSKHDPNGHDKKRLPIDLPVLANTEDDDGISYIVVGEAEEDLAFEHCEDLETALEIRAIMLEDGFTVRLFEANEIEVVDEEEPAK